MTKPKDASYTPDAIHKLKERIALAFPSTCKLSHEDCVELRSELVSLCDEDIFLLLGLVLIDMLETHKRSTSDDEDSVVRFLSNANPPPLPDVPGLYEAKRALEEHAASQKPEYCELFGSFTREQVDVVCEWLRIVKSWDDACIHEDELCAALEYWESR